MQTYRALLDTVARCLMKEGLTFIEAHEKVLIVGRLDPYTTPYHFAQIDPSSDPEALLEFKAYNASCRLQRQFSQLLSKYPELLKYHHLNSCQTG